MHVEYIHFVICRECPTCYIEAGEVTAKQILRGQLQNTLAQIKKKDMCVLTIGFSLHPARIGT